MPAKTKIEKVLHHLDACFQSLTPTNKPAANIIYGNDELYVLSHIPDNFQGVAVMVHVLDHLSKSSRVDFVTDISKENSIQYFGRKERETPQIFCT